MAASFPHEAATFFWRTTVTWGNAVTNCRPLADYLPCPIEIMCPSTFEISTIATPPRHIGGLFG